MLGHVLTVAAFVAIFAAGMFARNLWQHEIDLFRRSRLAAGRVRPAAASVAVVDSEAFGTPYRFGDRVAGDWPVRDDDEPVTLAR